MIPDPHPVWTAAMLIGAGVALAFILVKAVEFFIRSEAAAKHRGRK